MRNSNTTAIDYPFLYSGFNLGCFIDIVPIDNLDLNNDGEMRFEVIKELVEKNSVYMRLDHPQLSERDKQRIRDYDGSDPDDTFQRIMKLSQADNGKNTTNLSLLMAPLYGFKRNVFNSKDFDSVLQTDFDGLTVNIPRGYDGILKVIYGNYMSLPPISERGSWHRNLRFDPEVHICHILQVKKN